ncbi:MAG: hypothetical protein V4478_02970 [Patescibacteria group bacterium]
MQPFNFSIRAALKDSWNTFAKHWGFFIVLALVLMILNSFTNRGGHPIVMGIAYVAIIIWTYVLMSVSLAGTDHKDELLNFKSFQLHTPTFRQFFGLIGIVITIGVVALVLLAFPLVLFFMAFAQITPVPVWLAALAVPVLVLGAYLLLRSSFVMISYVDRPISIKAAFKHSWKLTKGKAVLMVLGVAAVSILLFIGGFIALIVGILAAYPLSILLTAHLYRSLTVRESQVSTA